MRKVAKLMSIILMMCLLLTLTTVSYSKGPFYKVSTTAKITHKLLRGLFNIPVCWVEIPISINQEVQNLDPFTGFFTGLAKGTCNTVKRLGSAVWDVLTFPVPYPENYKSFVSPEFPFMEDIL